jgi:hypothetical protein
VAWENAEPVTPFASDLELARRALEGDPEAKRTIVSAILKTVSRQAASHCRSVPDDAEELVQETILWCLSRRSVLANYRGQGPLYGYLQMCTQCHIIDIVRTKRWATRWSPPAQRGQRRAHLRIRRPVSIAPTWPGSARIYTRHSPTSLASNSFCARGLRGSPTTRSPPSSAAKSVQSKPQ